MTTPDITSYVDTMLAPAREHGEIHPEIARAFYAVPRHKFLPRITPWDKEQRKWLEPVAIDRDHPTPEQLELVYRDGAHVTRVANEAGTSSSSQPALMVVMLALMDLTPGLRVLEIGAGTGYNAALIAELIGDASRVTAIDIQSDVVADARDALRAAGYGRVEVIARDGAQGAPERAPFDRIVATVGCTDVSPSWIEQLAPGGFALVPLSHARLHPLVRASGEDGIVVGRLVGWAGFMEIQGEMARPRRQYPRTPPEEEWETVEPIATFDRDSYGEFFLFASLCDPRAQYGGVRDGEAILAVSQTQTSSYRGDHLIPVARELYERWCALGRPAKDRYRMEFAPLGVAPKRAPDDAWTIDRIFYRQHLWLASDGG